MKGTLKLPSSMFLFLGLMLSETSGQLDDPLFALKVIGPAGKPVELTQSEGILRRDLHASIVPIAAAAQAGIIVFKPPASTPAGVFTRLVKTFVTKNSRDFQMLAVITSRAAVTIPTGRIIVQFKEDIGLDQARAFLAKAALKIVQQPSMLRSTRFVVEPDSRASQHDPIRLAEILSAEPSLLFAEPDMLSITPPLPANARPK